MASVLFLNIKGVFPNAVMDQLLHNMKKCHLPSEIISFTQHMLEDRKTKLRFDDFKSDWFPIKNGIGQGDPLSMLLYVIYNSDLMDIAKKEKGELALAFVDNTTLVIVGNMFKDNHRRLKNMMERRGGGYEWSKNHNSCFKTNKFMLMDFSLNRSKNRLDMTLRGITIKSSATHKFLRLILNNEQLWKAHTAHATAKGASYTILLHRLLSSTWGIPAKLI